MSIIHDTGALILTLYLTQSTLKIHLLVGCPGNGDHARKWLHADINGSSADYQQGLQMTFDTKEAAINFAERQGSFFMKSKHK